MKKIATLFILGLWAAVFLLACATPGGGPTLPPDTTGTAQASGSPSATVLKPGTPEGTAGVPVTGAGTETPSATPSLEATLKPTVAVTGTVTPPTLEALCQFCLVQTPHAIVAIDEAASYEVQPALTAPTPTGTPVPEEQVACTTVETLNGKQVVLCHGPQGAVITLNVCLPGGSANCAKFPITLMTCPLAAVTATPTANNAPGNTATDTPAAGATDTPAAGPTDTPTNTLAAGPSSTPTP